MYASWFLPKEIAEEKLGYRLLYVEEDGFLEVGLTPDSRIYATIGSYTKERGLIAYTVTGGNHLGSSFLYLEKDPATPRMDTSMTIIFSKDTLLELARLLIKPAAVDFRNLGERDFTGWLEDLLPRCEDVLVANFEDYFKGLTDAKKCQERGEIKEAADVLQVFPKRHLLTHLVAYETGSPEESITNQVYLLHSKEQVPYLAYLQETADRKTFFANVRPVPHRFILGSDHIKPTMAVLPQRVGIFFPPEDYHPLAVYGRHTKKSDTSINYLYYWKANALNPALLRLSVVNPFIQRESDFYRFGLAQGVAISFAPFPLPFYRNYLRGEIQLCEKEVQRILW